MFHLLPQKENKLLEREYYLRLILVCLIFLLASLVVGSVLLLPSYLLSDMKLADINSTNQQVKASIGAKEDPTLSNFLSNLRENLNALSSTEDYPPFSVLSKKITDIKGGGIHLDELSQNQETLTVGGVADNRQSLLNFSHNLEAIAEFKSVDLPVSDFAKDKNINFSLIIKLKKS